MTDCEMSKVLEDMVILVDNREKKNDHVLDYFRKAGIPYRIEKLETADYTFVLPNHPDLEMDKMILVERKNSADELAGNFTKDRERFTKEFCRVDQEKIHLVIETITWKKILAESYRSKLPSKAFTASLITWSIRYDCPVWFVGKEECGYVIHNLLYYELREFLKSLREGVDIDG